MLKADQLHELLYFLEVGTLGGRSWFSGFKHLSIYSSCSKMRLFCSRFTELCHQVGQEKALSLYIKKTKQIEIRLFFELLSQCDSNSRHSREMFSKYRKLLYRLEILKKKKRGLSLLPQFQAVSIILVSLFLVVLVPRLFPGFSSSFLSIGRWDLFMAGCAGLVAGFLAVGFILWWPLRNQNNQFQFCVFLISNSLLIASGCDLYTAWRRSLDSVCFPKAWRSKLKCSEFKSESMETYLQTAARNLPSPWHQILDGLSWTLQSGGHLSEFLSNCSDQLSENYFIKWEQEIKKASFFCLAPLYFLSFPSALFLLMGPLVMGLTE